MHDRIYHRTHVRPTVYEDVRRCEKAGRGHRERGRGRAERNEEKGGAEDGWLGYSVDGKLGESTGLQVRMGSGNERG